MTCNVCGGTLGPNEKFCRYCGAPVPAQPEAPASRNGASQNGFDATYMPDAANPYGNRNPRYPEQGAYNPGNQGAYPTNRGAYNPAPAGRTPNRGAYSAGQSDSGAARQPGGKRTPKYAAPKKAPAGKPWKKGLIIGGIAGAVVLAALIVVLILTGNPAAKVASAFAATGKEFAAVGETLNLSELGEFLRQESVNQDLDMKISSVNSDMLGSEAAILEGLGIRLRMDTNLEERQIGIQAVPYYGSADLFTVMLALEDDMVYFGLPEILPDDCYGVSTLTAMQDLENMGADLGEAAGISFNFFDIMQTLRDGVEESQGAAMEDLKEATAKLAKTIGVEKDGKRNVRINGVSTKCTGYIVTVPQEALEDWLYALEDFSGAVDYPQLYEEMFRAMNLPDDIVSELVDEMSYYSPNPNFDDLVDILEDIGDLELEVYVSGGKVAAVIFEEEVEEEDLEIGLYIGGKDAYVDEVTLELVIGNAEYTLNCEGNHSAKGGVFTDETTFSYSYNGGSNTEFTLTTELDTKAKSDNLVMTLEADASAAYELEGTWNADSDGVMLEADSFDILLDGEKALSLSLGYSAGKYARRVDTDGAVLLATIDEEGLRKIMADIETKAGQWVVDLFEKYPELQELM